MAQAPPILIYQPGGGVSSPIGSNPPVYSQAGTTALVEGQDYLDVVFGSTQTNDEWVLVGCIVVNETDVDPLNIWPGIITDKTEAGFRIYFNGMPDSGNYYLHWSVSGINIEPSLATSYLLSGPATGAPSEAATFTVSLPPSTYVNGSVVVTPSEGGLEIGVFSPETVTLTTDSPSETFTFTPAVYGETTITVNNDHELTDPIDLAFTVLADTYTLSGPSAGDTGVASTNFTVELPVGGTVAGTVTVTPADGGDGGTFTPTTATLTTVAPSDTFTYTPDSVGDKTISVTNDGGLTDPGDLSYVASTPFDPTSITGLKGWWKADAIPGPPADNAAVSPWPDSGGGGFDLFVSPGYPIFKTSILNGKPILRFASAGVATSTDSIPSNYTMFVVASAASISAGSHCIMGFGSGAGPVVILRRDTATLNLFHFNGVGFSNATEASGIVAGAWNYITADWDGANVHIWRNGTLKSTTVATAISGTGTYLGVGYAIAGSDFWDGDIAEILIYDSALSAGDRGDVEAYLAAKYGL